MTTITTNFDADQKWKNKYNAGKDKQFQICCKYRNGNCTGNKHCPNGRRHVDEHVARAAVEQVQCEEAVQDQPVPLNSLFQQGPEMN